MSFSIILLVSLVANGVLASVPNKRGLFDGNIGFAAPPFAGHNDLSLGNPNIQFSGPSSGAGQGFYAKPIIIHKVVSTGPVSPAEIATAISAAKEATSQVLQAQRRVQMAKEAFLHQQRIATQKEAHAAIAAQKAEAAAAVQRQKANAAATAVVLAQQRLAQAKAEVAEHQRIAASKEAHAANVIQKSASAAAEEIHRSEETAAKLASFQHPSANAYRHASITKDATLTAASAAVAASASHYPLQDGQPWVSHSIPFGHWH